MNESNEDKYEYVEKKPPISEPKKSSMQILSELFGTFDAEPPVIVKKEKKEKSEKEKKKTKKSKKKHKHKDKKHKKRRRSTSSSSSSDESEIDLAQILIKQEKDKAEKKIKIEGTSLSLDLPELLPDVKYEITKEEWKIKAERKGESNDNSSSASKSKISINDLNELSFFKKKVKKEEGEIDSDNESIKKSKKHKHKEKDREKSKKRKSVSRDRSESRDKKSKYEDLREKIKREKKSPERKDRHRSPERNWRGRERSRSRDRRQKDKYKDDYYYKDRIKQREHETTSYRDTGFYKSRDRSKERDRSRERVRDRLRAKSREKERPNKDDKWFMRDRYRGYESRDRSVDRGKDSSSKIDKKKLLEIARRNAVQMMKSGSLPGALTLGQKAQEKMIAAIKSGGKTVEELTDFCKSLSKKEELGELSSMSEKEESDNDEPFHHPFQLKDRPTTITMNIKNSVPLPTKSTQERTTELRIQFPVSSGQQHRVNEEWVPVSPSSSKAATTVEKEKPKVDPPVVAAPLAIAAPAPAEVPLSQVPLPADPVPSLIPAPPNAPPGPQVFPTVPPPVVDKPKVDISSVVSQRLTAMRKLQENPHDVQALTEMYSSNKKMQTWAKSKSNQQLGAFTGSTGVQVLSQAELSSGYQAWAKKNQLQTAAPVSGGMGMHLLQKMGWKPGEGLGKEKSGALEPLLLEVKLDKKGLVANEELTKGKKKVKGVQNVKTLEGKHPVSLLGEFTSKRKLGAPQYLLEFECGPDHKKNFLFKVVVNGVEYKPNVASQSKKEAKANAATLALKQIGLLV